MIPFIIAAIPIEVEPYPNIDWTDINRAAQISTKKTFFKSQNLDSGFLTTLAISGLVFFCYDRDRNK